MEGYCAYKKLNQKMKKKNDKEKNGTTEIWTLFFFFNTKVMYLFGFSFFFCLFFCLFFHFVYLFILFNLQTCLLHFLKNINTDRRQMWWITFPAFWRSVIYQSVGSRVFPSSLAEIIPLCTCKLSCRMEMQRCACSKYFHWYSNIFPVALSIWYFVSHGQHSHSHGQVWVKT